MAVLAKEFIDFETNQLKADADPLDFAGAVGSACTIETAPAPPYGTYILKCPQHKTQNFFRGELFTYTPGTRCITSIYFYFGSANFPPSFNCNDLCTMENENNARYWELSLTTAGNLELRDNADTLLTRFAVGSGGWGRIEIIWEPGNATSDWALYVDIGPGGFPVLQDSGTGDGDFAPAGASTDIGFLLRGEGGDPDPSPMDTYFAGGYILEGATDIEDRVGGREGKSGDWIAFGSTNGKITLNSATPHCDEDGVDGAGDDLTTGTWDDAGDDVLGTECLYERGIGDPAWGGGVKVAAPVSDPSDVVIAAKWIWYGKGIGFNVVYGRYDPAGDLFVVTNDPSGFIAAALRYARRVLDRRAAPANYDPTHDAQFVTGMYNWFSTAKAVRNTTLAEAWCYSLHAVPVLTGKPSIGRFGNAWRGKIGRPL